MSHWIIVLLSLVIVVQTTCALPLDSNESTELAERVRRQAVNTLFQVPEAALGNGEFSDSALGEPYGAVLSRSRRGLKSRLKKFWKKHLRPIFTASATSYVQRQLAKLFGSA